MAEIIIRYNNNFNEANFTSITYSQCSINYTLDENQYLDFNNLVYKLPTSSPLTTLVFTMESSINNLPVAFFTDGVLTQGLYTGSGIYFNKSMSNHFVIFLSKQNFLIAFYNNTGIELPPFLDEVTFKIYKSPYTEITPYTE